MVGSCRCVLPFLAALLFLMAAPCHAGTMDWLRTAWQRHAARGGAAAPPKPLAGPVCCKARFCKGFNRANGTVCDDILGYWQFVSNLLTTKPTNAHKCL